MNRLAFFRGSKQASIFRPICIQTYVHTRTSALFQGTQFPFVVPKPGQDFHCTRGSWGLRTRAINLHPERTRLGSKGDSETCWPVVFLFRGVEWVFDGAIVVWIVLVDLRRRCAGNWRFLLLLHSHLFSNWSELNHVVIYQISKDWKRRALRSIFTDWKKAS